MFKVKNALIPKLLEAAGISKLRGDPFLINREASYEVEGLVILNQCFITPKMVASPPALREASSSSLGIYIHSLIYYLKIAVGLKPIDNLYIIIF